ncbi:hypothetical protein TNCV_89191 [Trichonephila clavipes]|nr:hypothetical protein TNCV_89191 [Trichonephila clavipes]
MNHPKIYELSTVTYGTVSAPYLAQRTLTQLSMDEEANFPYSSFPFYGTLYMDDVLCGAATAIGKTCAEKIAALQLETAEIYLWSDSNRLAWLRKEPMDLKTFVQNRVAKIQELYPNQLWRHVPSGSKSRRLSLPRSRS